MRLRVKQLISTKLFSLYRHTDKITAPEAVTHFHSHRNRLIWQGGNLYLRGSVVVKFPSAGNRALVVATQL